MLPSYLYPSVVENESIFISKQRFIRFWFCRFFTPFNFQNRPNFFAPMSMTLSVRIRFNNLRFNSFLRTNRKSCRPIERCRKYSKNWEWKITDQERKKNWQKFDVFIVSVKSSAFIYATRVHRGNLSFLKYEKWQFIWILWETKWIAVYGKWAYNCTLISPENGSILINKRFHYEFSIFHTWIDFHLEHLILSYFRPLITSIQHGNKLIFDA